MSRYACAALALSLLLACNANPQPSSSQTSASEGQEQPATRGPACGKVTCAVSEVCCNPSCSVCTPPDGMCTQQLCMDDDQRAAIEAQTSTPEPDATPVPVESGVKCGKNTCAAGETCCNDSCGICTAPGGACIKMFCADGEMPKH